MAVVTHLSGTLSVVRADGSTRILSVRSEVQEGDTLSTARETYARVKFNDGAEVVLRPETRFKVESYRYEAAKPEEDNFIVSLLKGGMRSVTGLLGARNKERVSVQTSTATIGIRGTHFGLLMCNNDCGGIKTATGKTPANGLHVDVASGAVSVTNGAGSQVLSAGQFGFVASGNVAPIIAPRSEAVQVTMKESISKNAGSGQAVNTKGDAACSF
ncbi:MAG: FecR domain-containing protein [Actinomycetota bacterium]